MALNKKDLTDIVKVSADGVKLPCLLLPRSSHNKIVDVHDGRLKIKLTAPPVDGKANSSLIKYLRKITGAAAGSITITAGMTSRRKTVCFSTMSVEQLITKLIRQ